jgi:hypothetical protein
MTAIKFMSAAVIVAAMLATPVMARDNHMAKRHVTAENHSSASFADHYLDGHFGAAVPRAGALPAPPDDENCDVGDNPFIC